MNFLSPLFSNLKRFFSFFIFCFFLTASFSWADDAAFSPASLFNSGLNFRQRGAPLLAALWFRAYLESASNIPERQKIEKEIERLEMQTGAKSKELLQLAFSAADQIADDFWDEKREALERIAGLTALSGHVNEALQIKQGIDSRFSDASFYHRYSGEYFVLAHDYSAVQTELHAITDPAQSDLLLATLAQYQLLRNERTAAQKVIRAMPPSPARAQLLNQLAALYTRALQVKAALPLLEEAKTEEEKIILKSTFLLGFVKAGLTEDAEKMALEMGKNQSLAAKVVLGNGNEALQEKIKAKPNDKDLNLWISDVYQLTVALAWMGHAQEARKGCEAMRQAASHLSGQGFADYVSIACAYAVTETENFKETLLLTTKISPASLKDFLISLYWRLIYLKRYDDIQTLISSIQDPDVKAMLSLEFSNALEQTGKTEEAHQHLQQAYDLAVKFNLGFVLHDIALGFQKKGDYQQAGEIFRTEKMVRWIFLARELETRQPLVDLAQFIEKNKTDDLSAASAILAQAAGDWISAMILTRGIERRHNQK